MKHRLLLGAAIAVLAWPQAAQANSRPSGECTPATVAPSNAFNAGPLTLPGNFPGFESSVATLRVENDRGTVFALTADPTPHPFPAFHPKEALAPGDYTVIVDDRCNDDLKLVPTVRRYPFKVIAPSPLPRATGTITGIEASSEQVHDSIRYRVHLRPRRSSCLSSPRPGSAST